jgi:hypothetical protein
MKISQQTSWHSTAIKILVFLPVLALIFNALAWLQYGIDLPYYDDWRGYVTQHARSFEWQHLFQSYNDTLTPVGNVLNALSQHLLNGNTVIYQFLSMLIMLGLLLLLQWRLLVLALPTRLLAACAFSLTLFMLLPGSYWGLQNEAYFQGLPLVFLLAAIYLVLEKSEISRWRILTVFILGTLSGLTYTSGAFAILVVGIVFLLASRFIQLSERKSLVSGGFSLFAAGIMTLIPQIWVITVVQKGMHLPNTALALPTESLFWMYLLGKVGRALMPLPFYPLFSFIVVTIIVSMLSIVFVLLARWFIKGEMRTLAAARTTIIYITLCSMIFIYLNLISAARAHLTPIDIQTSWLGAFTYGFHRIHFFWVTLLWPWLAAASFAIAIKRNFLLNKKTAQYWIIGLISVSLALTTAIVIGNTILYRIYTKTFYTKNISCLLSEIQKGQGINCPTLYPADLSTAFVYAKQIGSSFIRYFPILPISIGADIPKPLFRLSSTVKTTEFLFKTQMPESLKTCMILDVTARLRTDKTQAMQLAYKIPTPSGGFEELVAKPTLVQSQDSELTDFIFQINSRSGFLDHFQLNAVQQSRELAGISSFRDILLLNTETKLQPFELKRIEVRCRLSPSKNAKK